MKKNLALIALVLVLCFTAGYLGAQAAIEQAPVYYGPAANKPASPFPGQFYVTQSDTAASTPEYYDHIGVQWQQLGFDLAGSYTFTGNNSFTGTTSVTDLDAVTADFTGAITQDFLVSSHDFYLKTGSTQWFRYDSLLVFSNATYTGDRQLSINHNGVAPFPRTFAQLPASPNGYMIYCSDCTETSPCAGSGNGALAVKLNSVWECTH
jgi:hypothetical protein